MRNVDTEFSNTPTWKNGIANAQNTIKTILSDFVDCETCPLSKTRQNFLKNNWKILFGVLHEMPSFKDKKFDVLANFYGL